MTSNHDNVTESVSAWHVLPSDMY